MTFWIMICIAVPLLALGFNNTVICYPAINKQKRINLGAFLSFIILFVFRALRKYTVGGDLLTYRELFYRISGYNWEKALTPGGYEKGFCLYNKILSVLSKKIGLEEEFQILLFVTGFLFTVALIYFIYDNSINPAISLFVYISFVYLGATFNNERQAVAIALLFFSFKYIKERKFKKFLSLVILAVFFHSTSIVFIVLYFAYDIKITKKYWVFVSLGCILTFVFSRVMLHYATAIYFTKYENTGDQFSGGGYGYLLFLVFLVGSTLFIFNKEDMDNPEIRMIIHMMVLAVVLQIFALKISYIFRATRLFSVAMIFYFPYVFKKIKNSLILKIIFIVVLFAYFVLSLLSDSLALVPYLWCWE